MGEQRSLADTVAREMVVTNPDGSTSPISQEHITASKKTLGIHDSPSGGNSEHLAYIKEKVGVWANRMTNGHLPSHMAWVAYKHQLWPGVRYGLGTMTNDLEASDNLLHKEDYRMLNILGVIRSVTKGLCRWEIGSIIHIESGNGTTERLQTISNGLRAQLYSIIGQQPASDSPDQLEPTSCRMKNPFHWQWLISYPSRLLVFLCNR